LVQVVPSEPVVTAAAPAAPVAEPFDWQSLLVPALEIIWALGALLCLIVAAVRVTRFSGALRWAGPAPAGVLWAMPGAFHNYANALLEAVEFVSVRADRPSALSAVPALASGMGQFSDLQGRLTMLKHGNVSRALSWGGMAAVFGLGALLLPAMPTIGQDASPQDVTQPTPAGDAARADQTPATPSQTVPAAPAHVGIATTPKAGTIDRSIEKMLSDMKILPGEDCTDAEYIRRAYLDLTGVTPPDRDQRVAAVRATGPA
jgi:hypothetical protein